MHCTGATNNITLIYSCVFAVVSGKDWDCSLGDDDLDDYETDEDLDETVLKADLDPSSYPSGVVTQKPKAWSIPSVPIPPAR